MGHFCSLNLLYHYLFFMLYYPHTLKEGCVIMCVFCKVVKGEIKTHTVYQDSSVMAFLDIDPINEGHILLIPKEHYLDADEMPEELLTHLMLVSRKLIKAVKETYRPQGYSVMQNGGEFNDIGHYHLHVFPRYTKDGFGWTDSNKEKGYSEEIARNLISHL